MASAFHKLIVNAIALAISVMIVYPLALVAHGGLFENDVVEEVMRKQLSLLSVQVIGKTIAPWRVWDLCGPTGSALYRLRVVSLSPRSTDGHPIKHLAITTVCLNGITLERISTVDAIEV